jgi:hypothetical protein
VPPVGAARHITVLEPDNNGKTSMAYARDKRHFWVEVLVDHQLALDSVCATNHGRLQGFSNR